MFKRICLLIQILYSFILFIYPLIHSIKALFSRDVSISIAFLESYFFLFICIGRRLPLAFLSECDIKAFKTPSRTLETFSLIFNLTVFSHTPSLYSLLFFVDFFFFFCIFEAQKFRKNSLHRSHLYLATIIQEKDSTSSL